MGLLTSNLSMEMSGNWDNEESIRLKTAYEFSEEANSKLPNSLFALYGQSGYQYRKFINKFIELTPDARYLEVGSWTGSTACSAMYGNNCKVLCIDNWDPFNWDPSYGSPRNKFFENINTFKNDNVEFQCIESDFATVDYSTVGKFNVYLFDGPHAERDQYLGISLAQQALDDTYLLIVDDWNWEGVRNGTLKALSEVGNKIVSSIDIRSTQDNTHPVDGLAGPTSKWHNGYFMAVIKK